MIYIFMQRERNPCSNDPVVSAYIRHPRVVDNLLTLYVCVYVCVWVGGCSFSVFGYFKEKSRIVKQCTALTKIYPVSFSVIIVLG